jgi:hypothetical protein
MRFSTGERDQLSAGLLTDANTVNQALIDKIDTLINVGSAYVDNTQRVIGMFTVSTVANQTVSEKTCVDTWMTPLDTEDWRFYGFLDGVKPLGVGRVNSNFMFYTHAETVNDDTSALTSRFAIATESDTPVIPAQTNYVYTKIDTTTIRDYTPSSIDANSDGIMQALHDFPDFLSNWPISPTAGAMAGWESEKLYLSYVDTGKLSQIERSNSVYHPMPNTLLRGFYTNNNSAGTYNYWGLTRYLRDVINSIESQALVYGSLNDTDEVDVDDQHLVANPAVEDNQPNFIRVAYAISKNSQGTNI